MKRQGFPLVVCPSGRAVGVLNEATAPPLCADRTFSGNPSVGWSHYHGSLTASRTFAFVIGTPYRARLNVGYRLWSATSAGAQAAGACFDALSPHRNDGVQIGAGRSVREGRGTGKDAVGTIEAASRLRRVDRRPHGAWTSIDFQCML